MCFYKLKNCGWNNSNTYGFHSEWYRNPSSFFLPSDRDFWNISRHNPHGRTTVPPPFIGVGTHSGTGDIFSGENSAPVGFIDRHKTSSDDFNLTHFLYCIEHMVASLK